MIVVSGKETSDVYQLALPLSDVLGSQFSPRELYCEFVKRCGCRSRFNHDLKPERCEW